MIKVTRHHVVDEEKQELTEFRTKAGPQRMAELGREFLAAKRWPRPARTPTLPGEGAAQRIARMLVKPLEQVRDRASEDGDWYRCLRAAPMSLS